MLTRNIKFKLFQTKPFLIVLGMAFLIFSGVFLFSSTAKAVDCSIVCQHQTPPQCPDVCTEDNGIIYWCDCYQYLTSCEGKIQDTCGSCEECKDDSGCYNTCDEKDGWYDVDDSYPCCNSETGESCACQKQEKRDYYCDNGSCAYNVDDNRTIYSDCSSCSDGDSCTADSCSDGVCSNTPITTCANGDGCCPSGCNHNNDNDCSNQSPSAPTDPTPSQNATDVSAPSLTLEWQGGDDPDGDSVTYYVYRCEGSGCTELNLLGNTTDKSWTVSDLEYSTTYRWQVVASDGDLQTSSSVWNFTTGCTITQCGTTIRKDGSSCVLGNDITCSGYGIIVKADNVTLDGQNHTIRGDGGINESGIYLGGVSNVTIRNFRIKNFDIGINVRGDLSESDGHNIYSNFLDGDSIYSSQAIYFYSSTNGNIYSNTITHVWTGIFVMGSDSNNIYSNTMGHGGGISVVTSNNNNIHHNVLND